MRNQARNTRRNRGGEKKSGAIAYAIYVGLFMGMTAMTVHALTKEGDIERTGASPVAGAVNALTHRGQQLDAAIDAVSR